MSAQAKASDAPSLLWRALMNMNDPRVSYDSSAWIRQRQQSEAEKQQAHLARIKRLLEEEKHDPNEAFTHPKWLGQVYSGGCVVACWSPDEGILRVNPLLCALKDDQLEVAELLLQYGANPEGRSSRGATALHEAVSFRRRRFIRLLLDHNADIEATIDTLESSHHGIAGFTALHLAVSSSDLETTKILVERGANVHVMNKDGWKPIDIAVLDRQISVVNYLWHQMSSSDSSFPQSWLLNPMETIQLFDEEATRLAQHLLERGISKTDRKHQLLYKQCLSEVFSRTATQDTTNTEYVELIVREVEKLLIEIASLRVITSWEQGLCEDCQRLQTQPFENYFQVSEHKPSLLSLLESAKVGCHLCRIFASALDMPSTEYSKSKTLTGSPQVKIQIMNSMGATFPLCVGCEDKHNEFALYHVDRQWHDAVLRTEPLDKHGTKSDRSLAVAKAWLDQCLFSHDRCRQSGDLKLPTRVLDVGSETNMPRLLNTNGATGSYIALSYCWGNDNLNLRTTRASLEQHLDGIPFNVMPKTIQDAVVITRKLGIKYLWIDALCIVQDSPDDFFFEVERMGFTYSNAILTIAAKDAASCEDGILHVQDRACTAMFPLDLRFPTNHNRCTVRTSKANRLMLVPNWKRKTGRREASVLDSQAWTIQAALFSRRILCCWKDELSWSCLDRVCSEYEPEGSVHYDRYNLNIRLFTAGKRPPWKTERFHRERALYCAWFETVEDYTSRDHARPEDKLIVLAGLQKRIAAEVDNVPIIGLWRDRRFLQSMLWTCRTDELSTSLAKLNVPSWSWASTGRAVTYRNFRTDSIVSEIQVKSWNLEVIKENVCVKGSITIRCQLLREQDLMYEDHYGCFSGRFLTREILQQFAGALPDEDDDSDILVEPSVREVQKSNARFELYKDPQFTMSVDEIWYMVVGAIPYEPPPRYGYPAYPEGRPASVILMCIEKIAHDKMHFRRVGMAEAWSNLQWRDRAQTATIELF